MTEDCKRIWDVILTLIAMVGTAVAFSQAIREWGENLKWRRAEQLERYITQFESTPLLRVAQTMLDWTARRLVHEGQTLVMSNVDALIALRTYDADVDVDAKFTPVQVLLRESLDALLSFFVRLHSAAESRLLDSASMGVYFRYWIERLLDMQHHPTVGLSADDQGRLSRAFGDAIPQPAELVAKYIVRYSNARSIFELSTRCAVDRKHLAALESVLKQSKS